LFRKDLQRKYLWRLDKDDSNGVVLYVQSGNRPDIEYLAVKFPGYANLAQSKNFSLDPVTDDVWGFRLKCNTCKYDNAGRRIGIYDSEGQTEWIRSRCDRFGFEVIKAMSCPESLVFRKNKADCVVRLASATIDGILRVTNKDKMIETMSVGIGPAKGFGFGLMTLRRL
jgi:CRISPR system Cascade subunit CasE